MLSKLFRLAFQRPDELYGRLVQRTLSQAERASGMALQGALLTEEAALEVLRHFLEGRSPFFAGATSPRSVVSWVRDNTPELERATLERADRILLGAIPLLGLGDVQVGVMPDWHHEPMAKRTAPRLHWSRVPYLDLSVVGDHKIVWELNRHQYLVTLAQAWLFSREDRYADHVREHLISWISENPPTIGINWASSLEQAYRLISWCWALRLLAPRVATWSAADRVAIVRAVQAQGRHVFRYLSHWFSPNTHLTGEALGLLYLASCFPGFPEANAWNATARRVLDEQATIQVHADGVYFEQATQYHRYTAEIYLHYLLLGQMAGLPVPTRVQGRLEGLFQVLQTLTRSNGTYPLLGDDDGGRLVQLELQSPDDACGLLWAAVVALDQPEFARGVPRDSTMAMWLLGSAGDARPMATGSSPSRAFPVGGLFTMVEEDVSRGHLVIKCGPHGALSSGHAHADALAVDLWCAGGPLFVDSGTLTYDGQDRNRFRSALAHNTLTVDEQEVSEPDTPFRWRTRVDSHLDAYFETPSWQWFEGHHDGYARIAPGMRHSRSVWHPVPGVWIVEDRLPNLGGHTATVRWHLHPEALLRSSVVTGAAFAWEIQPSQGTPCALLLWSEADGVADQVPSVISPQYGAAAASQAIRWQARVAGNLRMLSIVVDWCTAQLGSIRLLGGGERSVLLRAALPCSHSAFELYLDLEAVRTLEGQVPLPPVLSDDLLFARHIASDGAPQRVVMIGRRTDRSSQSISRDYWGELSMGTRNPEWQTGPLVTRGK